MSEVKFPPFAELTANAATSETIKANIAKVKELFTPSSEAAQKVMANPAFAYPDPLACKLICDELDGLSNSIGTIGG